MSIRISWERKLFIAGNSVFIIMLTVLCFFPVWNVFCMSLSDAAMVSTGAVTFWPRQFTTEAYQFVIGNAKFWTSLGITLLRVIIGVPVSLILTVLAAYPLSRSERTFPQRKLFLWFIVITMLFSGGLVPGYMVVAQLGLIDSIWSLVLPGAVSAFNVLLLMNFFRTIPGEIEEAAQMEGAGQFYTLTKIMLPLAVPAIATVALMMLVGHWNAYFDGIIFMNHQENYPMQTYLWTVIQSTSSSLLDASNMQSIIDRFKINDRNLRAAEIFISMAPIIAVYPFLQRYFTTGLVLGSVKG